MTKGCYFCDSHEELRPYAHDTLICYSCMHSSPERRRAAEEAFYSILDRSKPT